MSKYAIGVGDDFPLDESRPPEDRHAGNHECRARHSRHHHGHHHHHHHGFGRLALLLVVAGLAGLIVEHQLTRNMALGLVAGGIGLMVLMVGLRAFLIWRYRRRANGQVS